MAAAGACGCVLVALVDPPEHTLSPPCPLRAVTGWWCPLCGATRAASRLIRGDLDAALRFNLVFVVLLPVVAAMWAAVAFPGRLRWLDPLRRRWQSVVYGLVAVLTVFMVVRNLPGPDAWLRYPGA